MEDNTKDIEPIESEEYTEHKPKYTRQQNMLYTMISIVLFCLVYFGEKGVIGIINRPYYMVQNSEAVSEENLSLYFEESQISEDFGLIFENARLTKNESGYILSILFSGAVDTEDFAENGILFNYGDPIEDISTEIYPYIENPTLAEYENAIKYVNIDDPNNEILIFEHEDITYVKYQAYGNIVPADVKILFRDCEKVY